MAEIPSYMYPRLLGCTNVNVVVCELEMIAVTVADQAPTATASISFWWAPLLQLGKDCIEMVVGLMQNYLLYCVHSRSSYEMDNRVRFK
jgi:hypothetical protein